MNLIIFYLNTIVSMTSKIIVFEKKEIYFLSLPACQFLLFNCHLISLFRVHTSHF